MARLQIEWSGPGRILRLPGHRGKTPPSAPAGNFDGMLTFLDRTMASRSHIMRIMRTRIRRLLALGASLLLLAQAAPVAAMCRCDVPSGASCCGPAVPEDDHGCCPSETGKSDVPSYSGPDCQKELAEVGPVEASLPLAPPSVEEHAMAFTPSSPASVPATPALLEGLLHDAPPGPAPPPAYLLHAVLRI